MKSRVFGRLPLSAAAAILAVTVGVATGPSIVLANSPIAYQEGKLVGHGSQVVFNSALKNANDPNQVAGRYIIRFPEDPVPVHFAAQAASGSTQAVGLYKAQGAKGRVRLDMSNSAVVSYAASVVAQQTQHLSDIKNALGRAPNVSRAMQYALNAVVVDGLSTADAQKIAALPGVASIHPDILRPVATDIGPGFIGAASIWWNAKAGQDTIFASAFDAGTGYRGDGVVIGDIDTGYNSLSPSFSATDNQGYVIQNPLGNGTYIGECGVSGINLAGGCNDKVIGVYDELGILETGEPTTHDYVEDSTLDGHGSHTGSTAAGNSRSATINNYTANLSGVAPHANMVIYRACYDDSCPDSATSGSADQAIQDGIVDALNFSISGGTDPWNDPTSLAFLSAADAGIFVAAAGGNTGVSVPVAVPGSVNHSEPWVTTVAASTHTGGPLVNSLNITGPATAPVVSLFATFTGSAYAGFTAAIPNSTLVVSPQFNNNSNLLGTDSCTAYTGTPFQGDIVVVSRGTCTFAIKAANLQAAGAVALVMSDNRVEDVTQQSFTFSTTPVNIPAFFVSQSDGTTLQNYLTTNATGVTAAIPLVSRRYPTQGDVLAGFSLLGPSTIDVIKPDIEAPGVNILAAVANDSNLAGPNSVAFYNGTSMATPHTAGTGALLLGLHPDWSPLEAKSAIMMTAKEVGLTKADATTASTYFDRGSGRIQADVASKAGLVLNETGLNFSNANPATGGSPSTLNLASMQNGDCVTVSGSTSTASCSFSRKFRSTQDHSVTWTPSFSGDVTATASPFVVAAHANSQPIQVNVNAAAYNSDGNFHFGEMTLTPSDTTLTPLHLTLAIRVLAPTIKATPSPLTVNIPTGTTGTAQLTVKNIGGPTLTVSNTNDTAGTTSATILDQPRQGSNGFYSSRWTDFGGAGTYGADDFSVVGPSSNLSKLSFPGFVTGSSSLASFPGNKIHFEIYTNASGIPSGMPEDASPSYVWHYVATIGSTPGLTITGETISIDLAAAGATPTALPAGTYWMVVYPEVAYGTAGVGWAWFESAATFGSDAHTIDPDQIFSGTSGGWDDIVTAAGDLPSFAMHIEQAVACGAPWLNTTAPTLSLGGGLSAPVTVTVDSTAFNIGQNVATAFLCMDSNDPVNPVYAVPVTATAVNGGPQPPTVAKAFAPNSVLTGVNSTVTITLSNVNGVADTLTAALTDTLPTNLVATAGTAATTCGSGVASVGAGGTSIVLASGAQIPAHGSCTVTATVTSTVVNSYTNTIAAGALQTDKGNNAALASAALAVTAQPVVAPTISKSFLPTSVTTGTASTLTITLANTNATAATLSSALTDTFPTGLVVATTPAASTTCAGTATVTAVAGSGSVALSSGAQIPANGNCTVIVSVQSATAAAYANSIAIGALTTDDGSNAAAANATLNVTAPLVAPTIAKSFAPVTLTGANTTTLTITLSNSNATPATLSSALTDTFPTGLTVATTPAASTTCTGGTVTATAGASSVSLASGAAIPASSTCTVKVNVLAAGNGTFTNTIAVGSLVTNAGNSATAATATLTVRPAADGSFLYSNIGTDAGTDLVNGATTTVGTVLYTPMICDRLTLSQPGQQQITSFSVNLSNHNAASFTPTTIVSFYDDSGASGGPGVRLLNAASIYYGGGNYSAAIPSGKFQLTAAPFGYTAAFVPAPVGGGNANVWACVNYSGTTAQAAQLANMGVEKFTNAPISGSTTDLAFVSTGGASFTDNPPGTLVSTSGGTANVFGWEIRTLGKSTLVDSYQVKSSTTGAVTTSTYSLNPATGVARNFGGYATTITAPTSGNAWGVTGLVLHPICTATTNYTDVQATIQFWDTFAGSTGTPVFSNSAPIAPVVLDLGPLNCTINTFSQIQARLPSTVMVGTSGSLGMSIQYSVNTGSGLVAAGDLTSLIDSAANGSVISVGVNASTGATGYYKSASNLPSLDFTTGDYVTATRTHLVVRVYGEQVTTTPAVAPTISKSFAPTSVTAGSPSTLTITLANTNATAATLSAALTDTFPSGLVVAATPNASTTCTGTATVTATAGAASASLSTGAQIPANGSCVVNVDVTSASANSYANTIAVGGLQTNKGNNAAAANATLTVNPSLVAPTAATTFAPTSVASGTPSTLKLTLSNSNASALTLGAALTTALPGGVVVAPTPNAATTCGGAVTGAPGDTSVSLASAGSSIPANGSCTVNIDVQSATAGAYSAAIAAGALQTNGGNNAAAASGNLIVTGTFPTPYCTKTFGGAVQPITSVVFTGISNTSVATVGSAAMDNFLSVTGGLVGPGGYYPITVKANTDGNYTDYIRVYFDWNHDGVFNEDASERFEVGSVTNSTGTDAIQAAGGVFVPAGATPGLTRMRVVHDYGSASAVSACDSTSVGQYGQTEDYLVTVDPTAVLPPAPPFVTKTFSPNFVASGAGGISTLTITLTNYNTTALATTATLTDTFPTGLVVAPTPNASTTCGGAPAVTATAGGSSVVLASGASIPGSGTCNVSVDVTTATGGIYVNTIAAGAAQSVNGNSPNAASATVQFASAIPTYSTGFESPFTAATVNGQQSWYSASSTGATTTDWKVAATHPSAGTQQLRGAWTTAGSSTAYSFALSPTQNSGTTQYSSASAKLAITTASTGATYDFAPQDNGSGSVVTRVRFLKSGTAGLTSGKIEVLDPNATSTDGYTDTGATWTGSATANTAAYFTVLVVSDRVANTFAVCINGTSIWTGPGFGASIDNVAILGNKGTGSNNNALDVDTLVVDNLTTDSGCTPPPAVAGGTQRQGAVHPVVAAAITSRTMPTN